jgi:hypothetical protein
MTGGAARRAIEDETTAAMYRRHREGASIAQIAREYGIDNSNVSRRFSRRGLKSRPYGDPWKVRVFSKIAMPDANGCMRWMGAVDQGGYGMISAGPRADDVRSLRAHRAVYEMLVGEIPEGLVLDHLCRVRDCVNPDHLDPVTQRENAARGVGGRHNLIKTHCPKGHEYTPQNVYLRPGFNNRNCRTCANAAKRAYKERMRRSA